MDDSDRTASLMTPAKLAQVQPRGQASPAAWLDQMAADAGHAHVRRLGELRIDMQTQASQRDISPLVAELTRLGKELPTLDFGLLAQRGWWAKVTGQGRSAGAQFSHQFEEIDEAVRALASQAQALQRKNLEAASSADRTAMEVEVEYRAIDRILDQGTRWLQDMRSQLKIRQAASPDAAAQQQISADTARCETLVERLKDLRAVTNAAQQAHQHAKDLAARRFTLLQTLQQALTADVKEWRTQLSRVASAAAAQGAAASSQDSPAETHRELQLCIKQLLSDCAQLQAGEKALGESLGALGMQLDVVG